MNTLVSILLSFFIFPLFPALADDRDDIGILKNLGEDFETVGSDAAVPTLTGILDFGLDKTIRGIEKYTSRAKRYSEDDWAFQLCASKQPARACRTYGGVKMTLGFGLCAQMHSPSDCNRYGGMGATLGFGLCTQHGSPSDCKRLKNSSLGVGICSLVHAPSDCAFSGGEKASTGWGMCAWRHSPETCKWQGSTEASIGFGLCTQHSTPDDCKYHGGKDASIAFGICSGIASTYPGSYDQVSQCGRAADDMSIGFAVCAHKHGLSTCRGAAGEKASFAFGLCSLRNSPRDCK